MAAKNDLVVGIGGDARGFRKAVTGVEGGLRGLRATTGKVTGAMSLAFKGLVASLGPLAAAFGIFATVKKGLGLAAEFESTKAAMGSLLGDFDKAGELLGQIEQFSASTPFQMTELSDAARGLLAFGRNQQEVMGDLAVLGDIAAATNKPIADFVDIFGKVRAGGRASMEEINRLAERGVPIYSALAQTMGVAESEVRGLVSAGQVGFPQLNSALQSTTGEGGKFFEGMKNQSTTLNGLWSTLKDNFFLILKDIGQAIIDAFGFKEAIAGTTSMAQTFRTQWMPTIKSAINAVASVFKGAVALFKSLWNGFIGSTIKEILFLAENWDLFFLISVERVKLWASNAVERVKWFFSNFGELMRWLGANWPALLTDMSNFTVTAAKNMASNMGEFFKSVLDFAKGKGFNPEFKSLTDGFESSLKELPKLTKAAVKESTPELDRLMAEATAARIDFDKRFNVSAGGDPTGPPAGAGAAGGIQRQDFESGSGVFDSTAAGTKEAFQKIFAATGGVKQSRPEDETAKNTEQMAVALGDMKRLWERLEKKLGPEKALEFLG